MSTAMTSSDRAALQFGTDTLLRTEPYGEGHINETYAAYYRRPDGTEYRNILQKINTYVFTDPDGLMENIHGVTSYLRTMVGERETMTVIPTNDGKLYYRDPDDACWRSYIFIEDATAYQRIEKDEDFFTCGDSFGRFQQQLADYPAAQLHETMPVSTIRPIAMRPCIVLLRQIKWAVLPRWRRRSPLLWSVRPVRACWLTVWRTAPCPAV